MKYFFYFCFLFLLASCESSNDSSTVSISSFSLAGSRSLLVESSSGFSASSSLNSTTSSSSALYGMDTSGDIINIDITGVDGSDLSSSVSITEIKEFVSNEDFFFVNLVNDGEREYYIVEEGTGSALKVEAQSHTGAAVGHDVIQYGDGKFWYLSSSSQLTSFILSDGVLSSFAVERSSVAKFIVNIFGNYIYTSSSGLTYVSDASSSLVELVDVYREFFVLSSVDNSFYYLEDQNDINSTDLINVSFDASGDVVISSEVVGGMSFAYYDSEVSSIEAYCTELRFSFNVGMLCSRELNQIGFDAERSVLYLFEQGKDNIPLSSNNYPYTYNIKWVYDFATYDNYFFVSGMRQDYSWIGNELGEVVLVVDVSTEVPSTIFNEGEYYVDSIEPESNGDLLISGTRLSDNVGIFARVPYLGDGSWDAVSMEVISEGVVFGEMEEISSDSPE